MLNQKSRFLLLLIFISIFIFLPSCRAASISDDWKYCSGNINKCNVYNLSYNELLVNQYWIPYNINNIANKSVDNFSWYATTISKGFPEKDTIYFFTYGQSVNLWLDGELIYSFGDSTEHWGENGSRWHTVHIPEPKNSSLLLFEVYTPYPKDVKPFKYISLNSEEAITQSMFLYDFLNVVSLPIAICIICLMLIFGYEKYIAKRFCLSVVLFLVVTILWLLGAMSSKFFILDAPLFWWYEFNILTYVMPIIGNFVLSNIIHGTKKKIAQVIAVLFLMLFVVAIYGEVIGIHSLVRMYTLYNIMLLILQPIVWYYTFLEAKSGNIYAKVLLVPVIIQVITGIGDTFFSNIQICGYRIFLSPLTVLGFIWLMLVILKNQVKKDIILTESNDRTQQKIIEILQNASIDSLTKCLNRSSFHDLLEHACEDSKKHATPFSLIMCDIDFFKKFNDRYGHDTGDLVLKEFADKVRTSIGKKPFIRWGGEEFIILCPKMNLSKAANLAEKIRFSVSTMCINEPITTSVGVATWHLDGDSPQDLFRRMDEAMYYAKEHGRNRIMTEEILQ